MYNIYIHNTYIHIYVPTYIRTYELFMQTDRVAYVFLN